MRKLRIEEFNLQHMGKVVYKNCKLYVNDEYLISLHIDRSLDWNHPNVDPDESLKKILTPYALSDEEYQGVLEMIINIKKGWTS